MKTIKDWNRGEIAKNEVFHFQHSLRPFIAVQSNEGEYFFVDIDEGICYNFYGLEFEGLKFYKDETEKDLDFMGVEIDGKIDWVE